MKRLLFAIRAIYHAPNPYHNYVHAIDVLQATYSFLLNLGVVPDWSYLRCWTPGQRPWTRPSEDEGPSLDLGTQRARDVLRPQDVLTVLLAAMGHDVGHPGLSNAFMVSGYLAHLTNGTHCHSIHLFLPDLSWARELMESPEKRQNTALAGVRRQVRAREHALHAHRPTTSETRLLIPHRSAIR